MLSIGNKTFMNLQEAVGWLLENNALPFQSTANYIGNTEIAMSTLINPSPAKVRVGSIIFFADSKVSTVVGVTSNSFIVSDQYNDLVDDIVYVSNVAINASGHLIVTLSNGESIDAGLIKQVSNFSINGSQHLIVTYNDGTTTDLGAIFSGNINISGTLNATAITGDSIIENMPAGYYNYLAGSNNVSQVTLTPLYVGVVKNGNKLTICFYGKIQRLDTITGGGEVVHLMTLDRLPDDVLSKLIPSQDNRLEMKQIYMAIDYANGTNLPGVIAKSGNALIFRLYSCNSLTLNTEYLFRFEVTFLLSDNLLS